MVYRDDETGVSLFSTCYAMDNGFQTLLFLICEGRFDFLFIYMHIYILHSA